MTRVYLPVSRADLELLRERAALDVEGRSAYAVTEALRRAHPHTDDDEELEFLAYALAVGQASAPAVVLAADVGAAEPGSSGAAVLLRGLLPRSGVAALHVEHPVHSADGELLWYDASELDEVIALLVPTQD